MNKIDLNRYSSGLKRDEKYRETINATLITISNSLDIPFIDLYNALFFKKDCTIKGFLFIKS